MNCDLCQSEGVDKIDFESGNNAEIPVAVKLCAPHLEEHDRDSLAFEQKYAGEILRLAEESLIRD